MVGDPDFQVTEIRELHRAGPRDLSFFTHSKYRSAFEQTKAGAVLVPEKQDVSGPHQLICSDPYLAMATIAQTLYPQPQFAPGVHPTAFVDETASVDPTAHVGPNAVIMAQATIGPNVVIEAQSFVGELCEIGSNTRLYPGVRLLNKTKVGDRVILHSGSVIGSDGFGFVPDNDGTRHKIPQVGIVEVGDDCEIGANTTIDRATLGVTKIGAGTKLDNLVQVAHNVVLGEHCVMASQSGIAGSSTVGNKVIMGAQSGVSGHVSVCDGSILAGRAGVISDISKPGVYAGFPSMDHRQWLKYKAQRKKADTLRRTVNRHDQFIANLKTDEREEQ